MSSYIPASPKNLVEYQTRFSSEESCCLYLERLRWPSGFLCPKCGHKEAYRLVSRRLLQCKHCRRQTSVTAGTLMHRTKLPLRCWFWSIIQIVWHKRGVSAKQLQRDFAIGSYRTAWLLCHKIREAMGAKNPTLDGIVQVDDAYVGGVQKGKGVTGRDPGTKTPIVVMVEERVIIKEKTVRSKTKEVAQKVSGDIAIVVIPDVSGVELALSVHESVKVGSEVKTDGWGGYNALSELGFHHQATVGGVGNLPLADRAISNLKRWLLCTHGGRQTGKYLQRYINEFVYKFNRRNFIPETFESIARRLARREPLTGKMLRTAS